MKVGQHGVDKRHTWRKVHLAVDGHAKDVTGVEVTTVDWADFEMFEMVDQVEGDIEQIDAVSIELKNAFTTRARCAKLRMRRLNFPSLLFFRIR